MFTALMIGVNDMAFFDGKGNSIEVGTDSAVNVSAVKAEAIREINATRDCIRVGTFNVYVGAGLRNREAMKRMFSDYGLDFVGLQEVQNEAIDNNYPASLTSSVLPYTDGTESLDADHTHLENVILSRYPVEESCKTEFVNLGGESRHYTKAVVQLPRYKDYYPDGDQKLSIYCAHLDLYVNRVLQAQELCEAALADPNKFVVIVMDSNDFTANKDAWKVFTDAGFVQAHPGTSKTAATDGTFTASSSIDQIFCSSNMTVLGWNIVNPKDYRYPVGTTTVAISDHNLVYADLKLDYGDISYEPINPQSVPSTIYHVTRNMTNVKDSQIFTNVAANWAYSSTLTPDAGYTIKTVKVTMGGVDITESAYSDGNLSFTVTGDVVITAVAESE